MRNNLTTRFPLRQWLGEGRPADSNTFFAAIKTEFQYFSVTLNVLWGFLFCLGLVLGSSSLMVHRPTTVPLVSSIGTVLVSITLQSLWEAVTHVPARELAKRASGLNFNPAGQQRWGRDAGKRVKINTLILQLATHFYCQKIFPIRNIKEKCHLATRLSHCFTSFLDTLLWKYQWNL